MRVAIDAPPPWWQKPAAWISGLVLASGLTLLLCWRFQHYRDQRDEAWQAANSDALTGVYNRRAAQSRLRLLAHKVRGRPVTFAVLFVDIDHFKSINDRYGHAAGDQLLREAGQRLGACVSDSDTVARLGGDEFTVVLGNYSSIVEVEKVAERILARLAAPFDLSGRDSFVSASIGITLYPDDANELEQLLRNADAAMYRAKEAGRNAFRYFTQEMNEVARRRLRLEGDLRRAIDNNELEVHFQPIVDINGRIAGAEALARWHHRVFGYTSETVPSGAPTTKPFEPC